MSDDLCELCGDALLKTEDGTRCIGCHKETSE